MQLVKTEDITGSSDRYNFDFINPQIFRVVVKDDFYCCFQAGFFVANLVN